MKWLTQSQIARRAKNEKDALKVSYEHWDQLYTAKAKELRREYARTKGCIADADYCGLCCYRIYISNMCSSCIFNEYCPYDGIWDDAYSALRDWINRKGSWHIWKRASKAVRDKLKELMDEY